MTHSARERPNLFAGLGGKELPVVVSAPQQQTGFVHGHLAGTRTAPVASVLRVQVHGCVSLGLVAHADADADGEDVTGLDTDTD